MKLEKQLVLLNVITVVVIMFAISIPYAVGIPKIALIIIFIFGTINWVILIKNIIKKTEVIDKEVNIDEQKISKL